MSLSTVALDSNPIWTGTTYTVRRSSLLLPRRNVVLCSTKFTDAASSLAAADSSSTGQGMGRIESLSQVKAYTTRVGSVPFPTEFFGERGELVCWAGVWSTTGRPRRCGWLDVVALKYRCQINGFSSLNLAKLDVLSGLSEIQLGVYLPDGTPVQSFPSDLNLLEQLKVQYEVLPGWKRDISSIRYYSDLPEAARQYVERIGELVGISIHYIGVGAGRDALIFK